MTPAASVDLFIAGLFAIAALVIAACVRLHITTSRRLARDLEE